MDRIRLIWESEANSGYHDQPDGRATQQRSADTINVQREDRLHFQGTAVAFEE